MRTMFLIFALLATLQSGAMAAGGTAYPAMAPFAQYAMASEAAEIALARGAAPPSISRDAEIMILDEHGYKTAVSRTNGFVCMVQRSWANGVLAKEFWSPKVRGPICFNAAAARSVLPAYLERTRWALAGASRAAIEQRVRAAIAANRYVAPGAGSMAFMMSKNGYLGDAAAGPWHPHLMFFQPAAAGGPASWGANLDGAPVDASADPVEPITTFFIPVAQWSDSTKDNGPGASRMHMQ